MGVKLREQLRRHQPIDPKQQWQLIGSREDWRTRGLARIEPSPQELQRQTPLSLSTFDINMMSPLQQEGISLSSVGFGQDEVGAAFKTI